MHSSILMYLIGNFLPLFGAVFFFFWSLIQQNVNKVILDVTKSNAMVIFLDVSLINSPKNIFTMHLLRFARLLGTEK